MHRRSIALIVAVATVLGCSALTTMTTPSATAAATASTGRTTDAQRGRDLFESLFFLQGGSHTRSLLKNAEISTLSSEEIDKLIAAATTSTSVATVRRIEHELTSSDPQYFAHLGSTVTAGNPVVVQTGLTKAYDEMLTTPTMAAAVKSASSDKTYVPGEIGTDCGTFVVVAAGVVIAVVAIAVATYALGVNIALGYNVAAGQNVAYQYNYVSTKDSLSKEKSGERFSPGVVAAIIDEFGN